MKTNLSLFTLGDNDLKPNATTSLSNVSDYIRAKGASCGLYGLTNYDIEEMLEALVPTYATKIDSSTYRITEKGFELFQRIKKLEEADGILQPIPEDVESELDKILDAEDID